MIFNITLSKNWLITLLYTTYFREDTREFPTAYVDFYDPLSNNFKKLDYNQFDYYRWDSTVRYVVRYTYSGSSTIEF